jgi:hypothetical protein
LDVCFGVCLHGFHVLLSYEFVARLRGREDRLGAVCRYKVGGAAETETDVFVPNETFWSSHFSVGNFLFVFWVASLVWGLNQLQLVSQNISKHIKTYQIVKKIVK